MGCWNQTCGLTQLHILAGQDVMVVPLVQTSYESTCYTTPFFTPFPVPFYAKYDDYGGGEDSTGIGLQLILSELARTLQEVEEGENEYHDIPVKREEFGEDLFWRAIHERRLKIDRNGKELKVGFAMIHMDVFNHLAENHEFSDYDYDSKTGKCTYYKYKLQDILDGIPEVVDALFVPDPAMIDLLDRLEAIDPDKADNATIRKLFSRFQTIENVSQQLIKDRENIDGLNRAAQWMAHNPSHMSYSPLGAFMLTEYIRDYQECNDREAIIEILTDYLKMTFIDTIMLETRKFWSPQAGGGSQSEEHSGYISLNQAIQSVLDEESARWKAEDGDETEE